MCVVFGIFAFSMLFMLCALWFLNAFRALVLGLILSCLLHRKLFYESPGGNQVAVNRRLQIPNQVLAGALGRIHLWQTDVWLDRARDCVVRFRSLVACGLIIIDS